MPVPRRRGRRRDNQKQPKAADGQLSSTAWRVANGTGWEDEDGVRHSLEDLSSFCSTVSNCHRASDADIAERRGSGGAVMSGMSMKAQRHHDTASEEFISQDRSSTRAMGEDAATRQRYRAEF